MKTILSFMVGLVAISALLSGILMVIRPDGSLLGIPLSLLDTTPIHDYSIPGVLLSLLVGGIHGAALVLLVLNKPAKFTLSVVAGLVLTGWILIQIVLIHQINWLHLTFLGMGLLIILLGFQLKGRWVL